MSVKFQDYYETLGVSRSATQEEIQRAYRQKARKYHPDVNKSDDAHDKFAQIGEAYEVLKDPAKRKRFDQLGADYKNGQEFRPPPGYENTHFRSGQAGGAGGGFGFDAGGQFSDFFEMFFNSQQGGAGVRGGAGGPGARQARRQAPREQEAHVSVTLDEAYHGTTRRLDVQGPTGRKTIEVKIPAGTRPGSKIRLGGEGLLLIIDVTRHKQFGIDQGNLTTDLDITPWQAALGDRVDVPTMDGTVRMTVPVGSQSGKKLRLKGKGLPARGKQEAGDLIVTLRMVIPPKLTDEQRAAYERLRELDEIEDVEEAEKEK